MPVAERDLEPNSTVSPAASLLNDAWVLVRRRPIEILSALVVRTTSTASSESCRRSGGASSSDRATGGHSVLHFFRQASCAARAAKPSEAVIPAELRSGVHGAGVVEVAALMRRAALYAYRRPPFQRLLKPRVAIGDDQQRRRESAPLEISEQTAPTSGRTVQEHDRVAKPRTAP